MQTTLYELPRRTSLSFRRENNTNPSYKINLLAYGGTQFRDETIAIEEIESFLNKAPVVWIDIEGIISADILSSLEQTLKIQPAHFNQILKNTIYPYYQASSHYHLTAYPQYLLNTGNQIATLVICRGTNFLLSIHDQPIDVIPEVQQLVRDNQHDIQSKSTDYLEYVLSNAAMQTCADLIESYGQHFQQFADNPKQIDTPAFDHLFDQVQRLNEQFVWPARYVNDESNFKAEWDDFDLTVNYVIDEMAHLETRLITLQQRHSRKIQQQQAFFLKIITGLLVAIVLLLLIIIIA